MQKEATFSLGDDGTLDTVIVCDACGEELRYNMDAEFGSESDDRYEEFVDWATEDARDTHVCS